MAAAAFFTLALSHLFIWARRADKKTHLLFALTTFGAAGSAATEAIFYRASSVEAFNTAFKWTDPDFEPSLPVVYYARVLEIPTPTWQAYAAKFYGTTMPPQVLLSHQERAYTSPIWYTP